MAGGSRMEGLGRAALAVAAVVTFAAVTAAILLAAGDTLGYDFLAYHAAAQRVLQGQPLYDLSYARAGGFGLFYYPPTFLPLVLPFGLLAALPATWAWTGLMIAALLLAIRLMPVSPGVRWVTLLLAGLSWPVAYTLKLGQVTPLLFLLAVVGWRAVEGEGRQREASHRGRGPREGASGPRELQGRHELAGRGGISAIGASLALGASAAVGAAIKLQPGLLLAWALLTARWRAVLAGVAVLVVAGIAATVAAGPGAWGDYVTLIRQVTDPVTTEHNATPGWVAHGLGLSVEAAAAFQVVVVLAALAALVISTRVCTPPASFLVAVATSQLISPVLWDHYAMLLLLPVAWLIARGWRWAALIPLVTSLPLIWVTPLAAYPIAFAVTIAATLAAGGRVRQGAATDGGMATA